MAHKCSHLALKVENQARGGGRASQVRSREDTVSDGTQALPVGGAKEGGAVIQSAERLPALTKLLVRSPHPINGVQQNTLIIQHLHKSRRMRSSGLNKTLYLLNQRG